MSRIFIINNIDKESIGGIETFVENEIKYLKSECHLVFPYYTIADVSIWGKMRNLISWLRKQGLNSTDVIHLHDPRFTWMFWVVLLFNLGKSSLFLSSHGFFFHHKNLKYFKIIYFKILSFISYVFELKIICSSRGDFEICKKYGWHNFYLFENPIDNVFIKSDSIHISSPYYRFIYWGRTSENKNIELLISTFDRLYELNTNYHLTIVTSDKISNYSYPWLSIVQNSSTLELIKLIENQQCFISLSNYEGFGLAIYEAYSTGLIVCCSPDLPVVKLLEFNYFPIYDLNKDSIVKDIITDLNKLIYSEKKPFIRNWNNAGIELLSIMGINF